MTALARSGETLAAFPCTWRGCSRRKSASGRNTGSASTGTEDPYSFPPLLGELDVYLLAQGRHRRIAECLGAQPMTCDGAPGVRFAV